MRWVIFLSGMAALVVGVSSYFDGVPLPIHLGARAVSVGTVEMRLDFVLMMLGVPMMLLGLPRRTKWK